MKFRPSCEICAGFTLVEFIITISIVIILITFAVPQYRHFVQSTRVTTATNELLNAILYTRTEAIKQNARVDINAVDDDWHKGWSIINSQDKTIIKHGAFDPSIEIKGKFSDGKQHIAFNGAGRSRSANSTNSSQSGRIQISTEDETRVIVLNFLGNSRVCNPAKDKTCETISD